MAWNKMLLGFVVGALVACNGDMNVNDSGNDSGASDVTATDTGTQDTGSTTDTGSTSDVAMTDTGSGGDGGGGMYGTCGMTANTCLCMCGNDQTCQQGCLSDSACQNCVLGAQSACCPSEASALAQCAMRAQMASDAGAGCTTQACIQMRCMGEITAFQGCVNTASMSDTACQGHLAECFGNYPIQCAM
jgi:hypothetical protein